MNHSLDLYEELPGECSLESDGGTEVRENDLVNQQYWEYVNSDNVLSVKGKLNERAIYWREVLHASQFVFEVVSQGYRLPLRL